MAAAATPPPFDPDKGTVLGGEDITEAAGPQEPVERTAEEQAEIDALVEEIKAVEAARAAVDAEAALDAVKAIEELEADADADEPDEDELPADEEPLVQVVSGLEIFYVTADEAGRLGLPVVGE